MNTTEWLQPAAVVQSLLRQLAAVHPAQQGSVTPEDDANENERASK